MIKGKKNKKMNEEDSYFRYRRNQRPGREEQPSKQFQS